MTAFCPSCGTDRPVGIARRKETYTFRGQPIEIDAEYTQCEECSEEYLTDRQAQDNLDRVKETYRREHDLVGPAEIREIRRRYGVGQKAFSKLLGFGEATIASYEGGEVPTEAASNLISLAAKEDAFRMLLEKNANKLGPTQLKKVRQRLANGTRATLYPPRWG
jgi:putative zinc finger/helix-turn-helix YgiT family protein